MTDGFAVLQIVKGIPPSIPGDADNTEEPVDATLDLLNLEGFTLSTLWVPKLATLKGGGVKLSNPTEDSARFAGGGYDNVIEEFTLTLTGASDSGKAYLRSRLMRIAQDAIAFHTTDWQIEPVYLKVKYANEPYHRYATIFQMDVAQSNAAMGPQQTDVIELTIERQPFWHWAVPIGGNPRLYALAAAGTIPTASNIELNDDTTGHFAYALVNNQFAWDPTDNESTIEENYIDLPDVPGDAPALACITISDSDDDVRLREVFIARTTRPISKVSRIDDDVRLQTIAWNGGDAKVGTGGPTKTTTSSGPISNGSSTLRYLVREPAVPSFQSLVTWGISDVETGFLYKHDLNQMRGRYALVVRGEVTAQANPFTIQCEFFSDYGAVSYDVLVPETPYPLPTGEFLHYLGVIEFPFNTRAEMNIDGTGLEITPHDYGTDESLEGNLGMRIVLRDGGGTASDAFDLYDVLFLPLDNICHLVGPQGSNAFANRDMLVDNTGHLAHGEQRDVALYKDVATATVYDGRGPVEIRGETITLLPGHENRLYFAAVHYTGSTFQTDEDLVMQPESDMHVRVNIIPRSFGSSYA